MKKALLLSLRNSDFTEMFRLACALKTSGTYEPLIMTYTMVGNDIDAQQKRCAKEGIELKVASEARLKSKANLPPDTSHQKNRYKQFLWNFFGPAWTWFFSSKRLHRKFAIVTKNIFSHVWLFAMQNQLYNRMMREFKPDILVIAEDIVGMTLPAFIKTGHKHNIPSVIVPYTIANAIEAAESLYVYPNYQVRGIKKIVAPFFPRWVYKYRNIRLFRLPLYYIFAHCLFRLTPPDPWIMNSGYANAVAIENNHMKSYYLNEGFIEDKICVTGAIYDDTLTTALNDKENRLKKLYDQLGLPQGKPLLVVGAPPNQLATPRPECPVDTYDDVMNGLAETLGKIKDKWNIVIRPHPNFMDIATPFKKHNLIVTDIDTAELIPLSDIYIAYASATIRWAVGCGIPSINYDLFQYRYDDYKDADGVIHAFNPKEFDDVVVRLCTDETYYAETKAAQEKIMHDWGHTDGGSTKRMIQLFDDLIAHQPVPRTPTTKIRQGLS